MNNTNKRDAMLAHIPDKPRTQVIELPPEAIAYGLEQARILKQMAQEEAEKLATPPGESEIGGIPF